MITIEEITLYQKVWFIGDDDIDPCIGTVEKIYPPEEGKEVHSVLFRQEEWLSQKQFFLVTEFRVLLNELEFLKGEFFCCICGRAHKATDRCQKIP